MGLKIRTRLVKVVKAPRSRAKFPMMESELIKLFDQQRSRGRKVTARWFCAHAKRLMKLHYPLQADEFVASRGWRLRFCLRHKITVRRRTNGRQMPLAERLQRVNSFHRQLRAFLKARAIKVRNFHGHVIMDIHSLRA